MNNKHKYLKYKKKYLNLKGLMLKGGDQCVAISDPNNFKLKDGNFGKVNTNDQALCVSTSKPSDVSGYTFIFCSFHNSYHQKEN